MQTLDRALLVALNYRTSLQITKESVDELEELALACNIKTIDKVIQSSDSIDPRYYIGSGKVEEIKKMIDVLNIDLVIFDDTLAAGQLRNLEKYLDVQVIDRSFLILQIFAERAKTKQAMMEVALAQKLYMLPRLVGMSNSLSRQGGGSFNAKGPGETKLELDRRRLSAEISQLKYEISQIKKERQINVQKRIQNQVPVVALVGYTNAGKSSLMNYFTEQFGENKTKVFEKDMLFATLDTKAKRIKKDNHPAFILIDTVGFINKLPHELVSSFESTLSDITSADLILHIIDGKNPSELQIQLTKQILKSLGVDQIPRLLVVTKRDLRISAPVLNEEYIYISNKTGEGMDELFQAIDSNLYPESRIYTFVIPFNKGNIFQQLKEHTRVLDSEYVEDGIKVRVVLTPVQAAQYKKYINE
ncbi:GTPase HflX [Acholeplasma hippikon]|uniref:GTPase HflX n=1 Tax=Acholeplasma hippikon TaxID=264636 RepID=A0A449BKS3_9MOLU|nr:GTPase HflX [Acholeplasma hippikon]VEU83075.1 GTP-binding protein HflX [Acholeplasma hippikon]